MLNPITSASGNSDSADHPVISRHEGFAPRFQTLAAAIPTATCPRLAMQDSAYRIEREVEKLDEPAGMKRSGSIIMFVIFAVLAGFIVWRLYQRFHPETW